MSQQISKENTKLRFGIVGCGHISHKHKNAILQFGGEITACCDILIERANHGGTAYYDYKKLIKDDKVDVVVIATPNGLHYEMVKESILAGKKNIVVEKPLALHSEECRELIKLYKKKKVNLFVIKQNRYIPEIKKLKKAIEEGKLGKSYLLSSRVLWNRIPEYYSKSDWHGSKKLAGNTLINQAIHLVDLLYYLGGEIESVFCYMGNFMQDIEFEDTGVILLKFKSGALGCLQYTVNIYDQNFETSASVFGTRGTVELNGTIMNKIYWSVSGNPLIEQTLSTKPNEYVIGNVKYYGSSSNHNLIYQNIFDVLNGKTKEYVSADEGIKSILIAEACEESARTGKEVKVKNK